MTMQEKIDGISRREDLADFVDGMRLSFEKGDQPWENRDLVSFLEAMSAWVSDMDGYFQNIGEPCPESPPWKTIVQIYLWHRLFMNEITKPR